MSTEYPNLMMGLMGLTMIVTLAMTICVIALAVQGLSIMRQVKAIRESLMPGIGGISNKVHRLNAKVQGMNASAQSRMKSVKPKFDSIRGSAQRSIRLYRNSGRIMSRAFQSTRERVSSRIGERKSTVSRQTRQAKGDLSELIHHPAVRIIALSGMAIGALQRLRHHRSQTETRPTSPETPSGIVSGPDGHRE